MTERQPKHTPRYSAAGFFDFTKLNQFRAGHPWDKYRRLQQEAPIYWQTVDPPGRGYWVISRHQDIQQVSRNPQVFRSGQGFKAGDESYERMGPEINSAMGRILLTSDGEEHQKYRQLLQPFFSMKTVREREERTQQYVRNILDRLDGRDLIDAVKDVATELPILVLCDILGVPESDQGRILDWTNRMVGADDPDFNSSPQLAAQAFLEVFDYGRELVRERRGKPRDDLVSLVANSRDHGHELDEDQTNGFFVLFVGAGNETSRNSIAASLLALHRFPECRRQLVEDPGLIPGAVDELLRHITPVIHMRRTAAEDTEIAGQPIAAGEKVVMLYGAANRDPEVFAQPDQLDFERKNSRAQLAFGHGVHLCLGAVFARMELNLMLREFLRRYPDYSVAAEPAYLRSHFVHGIKSMPVNLQ